MPKYVVDLHLHSKYSRATSPKMNPLDLGEYARKKGIDIVATGDITHPKYFKELKSTLHDNGTGIYSAGCSLFILSGEVSNIYQDGKEFKRVHQCVSFKTLDEVEQFNEQISKYGSLEADGRPILSISAAETVEIAKSVSQSAFVFPAHIWTPWFSVYGSMSGYDSIKDCYQDMLKHIKCAETGLSSDPAMNWRIPELDSINMISNSDSHSPDKTGREANIIEVEKLTYDSVVRALETGDGFKETIEFYPEEGKYHYDGHRLCGVSFSPSESKKLKNICPVCRKQLTIGVMHRVEALAQREDGYVKPNAIKFRKIIPLKVLIAQYFGVAETSTKVTKLYDLLITKLGSEFFILLDADYSAIETEFDQRLAKIIYGARVGSVKLVPGYDGVYGKVEVVPCSPSEERISGSIIHEIGACKKKSPASLKDFF